MSTTGDLLSCPRFLSLYPAIEGRSVFGQTCECFRLVQHELMCASGEFAYQMTESPRPALRDPVLMNTTTKLLLLSTKKMYRQKCMSLCEHLDLENRSFDDLSFER